jgi:hypothetical protein
MSIQAFTGQLKELRMTDDGRGPDPGFGPRPAAPGHALSQVGIRDEGYKMVPAIPIVHCEKPPFTMADQVPQFRLLHVHGIIPHWDSPIVSDSMNHGADAIFRTHDSNRNRLHAKIHLSSLSG